MKVKCPRCGNLLSFGEASGSITSQRQLIEEDKLNWARQQKLRVNLQSQTRIGRRKLLNQKDAQHQGQMAFKTFGGRNSNLYKKH